MCADLLIPVSANKGNCGGGPRRTDGQTRTDRWTDSGGGGGTAAFVRSKLLQLQFPHCELFFPRVTDHWRRRGALAGSSYLRILELF